MYPFLYIEYKSKFMKKLDMLNMDPYYEEKIK